MTKIYTRTGDGGQTSLLSGERVGKGHLRVAACGTIEECNAALSIARVSLAAMDTTPHEVDQFISTVQHQLFRLGAELADPARTPSKRHDTQPLGDTDVARLEAAIDRWDAELAPLREFILPGGCPTAAQLHLARCVCRRAERLVVRLAAEEAIRGQVCRYLNRLSDALFVLARYVNQRAGVPDVPWRRTE